MDVAQRVGPAEIEQVVVAPHLTIPRVEARAAIAFLIELERLNHRAHGAVEHEDALFKQAHKLRSYALVRHYLAITLPFARACLETRVAGPAGGKSQRRDRRGSSYRSGT